MCSWVNTAKHVVVAAAAVELLSVIQCSEHKLRKPSDKLYCMCQFELVSWETLCNLHRATLAELLSSVGCQWMHCMLCCKPRLLAPAQCCKSELI